MLLLFWRARPATTTIAAVGGRPLAAAAAARGATGGAAIRAPSRATTVAAKGAAASLTLRGQGRVVEVGSRGTAAVLTLGGRVRATDVGSRGARAAVALWAPSWATAVGVAVIPVVATTTLVVRARGSAVVVGQARRFQYAVPIEDLAVGGWTNELGEATDLYVSLDEPNADFIQSSLSPEVVDVCRVRLGPLEYPGVTSGHVLQYRYEKDEPDGDRIDLTVRLETADALTVIAERTHLDIDVITDIELALSAAEAGAIPAGDYATGLVLEFRAVKV